MNRTLPIAFALGTMWVPAVMGELVLPEQKRAEEQAEEVRQRVIEGERDLSQLAAILTEPGAGNQLFYFPTRDEPRTPETWGFRYESVEFPSADGTRLHGWFMPPRAAQPKGTIVFSHGNAGSIGHHLGFVMWFVEAGYQVLTYDYRGFGRSAGRVDRAGMVEDARAAFDYVASRPDVDAARLISYGHSLGGAKSVAALASGEVEGLRAVVVDGTFASYREMARRIAGPLGARLVTDELSPRDLVEQLAPVPLLVIHGTEDEVVPLAQGTSLFERAREPKTFFRVEGGRHGDALVRNGGDYRRRLLEWLDQRLGEEG